jgi:hypothetical protein
MPGVNFLMVFKYIMQWMIHLINVVGGKETIISNQALEAPPQHQEKLPGIWMS